MVHEVTRLVNDPDSSADQINAIMTKDPAMAGKILQMVNSAFYGLSAPVNDLEQAIVIFGL